MFASISRVVFGEVFRSRPYTFSRASREEECRPMQGLNALDMVRVADLVGQHCCLPPTRSN